MDEQDGPSHWEKDTGTGCSRNRVLMRQEGGCEMTMQKTAKWGASWFLILNNYYSGYQIKKDEMGRVGGNVARAEEKGNAHRILMGKTDGKNHWEGLGVNAGIILK